MSTQKTIQLVTTLDDRGLEEAQAGLKQLDQQQEKLVSSSKKVETQSNKTSKGLKAVGENGGAIATLDALTGGLATRVRDTAEATKLFNFSLKGTRTALIATGIGAFIVALGVIVAYWEEIVDFITGANKQLEEQRILLESNAKLLEAQLKSINAEKALRIARGQGIDDLLLKEKALLKARIANRKEVFRTRKAELELAAQRFDEITATEEFLQFFGVDARTQEDLDKINELKTAAFDAKAAVKEAEKDLQDLENDIFDANAIVIGGEAENVTTKAKDVVEQVDRPKNLEAINTEGLKELEVIQQIEDSKTEIYADASLQRELIAEAEAEFQRAQLMQVADVAQSFGRLLSELGEENKTLAVAGIIVEQIASSAKIIMSTTEANAKAVAASPLTAGQPFVTINTVSAALGIAAGTAAAVKAISKIGGGGSAASGGGVGNIGGGGAQAPSFNLVGTSGVNQLADSLNQEQEPIQAFVVGSEVTSQQELDNQTQQTATVG